MTAIAAVLVIGGVAALSRPTPPRAALASTAPPTGSAAPLAPTDAPSTAGPTPSPSASASALFPGGLLIADRGNGRILVVDDAGTILWRFPSRPDSLPSGQRFSADDAFISPDGRSIVANDEFHDVIDRIDIATGRVVWQYGTYMHPGAAAGHLHTPDDAYPLANGDIVVADIFNCRILEIAPSKQIVRQWGRTGVCRHDSGATFGQPNGDTPLPDGGLLITEILGSRVVRLDAAGRVVFDIKVPVAYPSDAQLDADGNIVVADFSKHGQVVAVDPTGRLLWRYAPASGDGRLDHPSLATPLLNGLISINDDFRHRVVVIDPRTDTLVWQYGQTDRQSAEVGYLDTPDGHQPLPPGIFR